MKCAVSKCKNKNNSKACKISFYNFPLHPDLLKQWVLFCERTEKFNAKTSHICMEHFKPEDFENNLQFEMGFTKRRFLKQGAVPSVRKVSSKDEEQYNSHEQEIQKLENKKIVEMLLKEHNAESAPHSVNIHDLPARTEVFIVREVHPESAAFSACNNGIDSKIHYEENENDRLQMELELLRQENYELKKSSEKQSVYLRALEKQIKMECKMSKRLKTLLAKANYELNNLEEKLLGILTRGQIKKLKAGDKRTQWTEEDMIQAVTLYASSHKLYKLLHKNHFPLPAIRTLQLWRQKNHISPGTLQPSFQASLVLNLMKK